MATVDNDPGTLAEPFVTAPPATAPGPHIKLPAQPELQPKKKPEPSEEEWAVARKERTYEGIDWGIAGWLIVLHAGALAAPFTFTWTGLILGVVMYWITGCIGITLGFHRMLTHTGFQTYKPVRWFIAWIGGLAGEGSAIHWVANHRKHHAFSDKVGDPHSPLDGPWWSHMTWVLWSMNKPRYDAYNMRWAPDLQRDPVMRFLDRTFILWHVVLGFTFFGIGYAIDGAAFGWSLVVWGVFLRMISLLHATWLINSATHIWGYRNYKTSDESRNLWWVAMLTNGEGWHNNHHAYPRMARHGHKWWEIDTTFMVIKLMEMCGLAWNVVDGQHKKGEPTEEA
jgi:stearoyl-CoA desaturase (delta-9 desaturase)